ncbi:Hypothetical predicted protein [Paramuricea clavata]|uniref:Uncharacterized protein n=1 Tax=Paramuricea clavata TaxID=317549 RepID=A0A6S7H677_PARCT|nr:Hypothetical predicted protein [Paramuricea clavata]
MYSFLHCEYIRNDKVSKDIDIKKPVAQLTHNVQGLNAEERLDQFQGIVNPQNEDETEEMKRTNALYLLKLKETNFLTQTSLDSVVQGTTAMVKRTVKALKKEVEKKLEGGGLELQEIEGLSNLLDEDHPLSNPLAHVETKHQQTVFQKTNFSFVEPRRILLGHVSKRKRIGTSYSEVLVNGVFAYVPLLQSLEQLLNQPTVLTQVIQ